jgi:parallel beta-helix repeat protein
VLTGRTVTWVSSDASIVSVSSSGVVTALKGGGVTITASVDGGVSASAVVSAIAPKPAVTSIALSAGTTQLKIGQLTQITAVVRDASGNLISGVPVTFSANPTTIATVSGGGTVAGVNVGSATVYAKADTVVRSIGLTVIDTATSISPAPSPSPTVATIVVTLDVASLQVGQTTQAVAVARDSSGNAITNAPITWSSSNTAVATVSTSGLVTAVAAGSASITATSGGKTGSQGLTVSAPPKVSGVAVYPGQSIQAAVNANPAGTAFVLKAGTHVRQSVRPKSGDTFTGEAGTVLDGENATVYAFDGYNGAAWVNDVTIRKLAITRYTPPAQMGAIHGGGPARTQSTERWVLDSLDVHHNANLGVRIGNHMKVLRSNLHHNGTINIGGVGVGILVDGVEVAYGNNGCPNDPGFEAGGSKFAATDSLIVRNSYFHSSCGPGLWLDINNRWYLLENNRSEDNYREGIKIEISYGGIVRNNAVKNNGWLVDPFRSNGWGWDAGIGIHSSPDVEVYGNTLTENLKGIVATQQNRGSGPYGPYILQNLNVHDNVVYQRTSGYAGAALQDVGDTAIFTSRNNRWTRNTYYLGTNPAPFEWSNGNRTAAQWRGYGQDGTGVFNP